jgi:hypothetical protein
MKKAMYRLASGVAGVLAYLRHEVNLVSKYGPHPSWPASPILPFLYT